MARRLFYAEISGGTAYLRGETAQHLRKVLRGERGQRYEVSDGETMYLAELADFGKDLVQFRLLEPVEPAPAPVQLRLCASLIKFDHFEWLLEKATELGVARITPVLARRCDKGLDQAALKRMERWQRILLESGQQSRRLAPPALDGAVKLEAALAVDAGVRLWLEEQRGTAAVLDALPATRHADDEVMLLCGPEGGWEDSERQEAAAAGWRAVSLGPQILRAETAAMAALAVIGAAWSSSAR